MTQKEAEELCCRFSSMLGEHFPAVQIMVSWNEEAECRCVFRGTGNWYARQGMAHEFIQTDIARGTANELKQVVNPPDYQGDDWKAKT